MHKIKISKGLFRINLGSKNFVPCAANPDPHCNSSSARLFEYLFYCGSNVSSFYGGPTCKHGRPVGDEGLVAFMLEKFYAPALKFNESGSTLLSLIYRSAAILYFDNGPGKREFNIWDGQKLIFGNKNLTQISAKSVLVWPMGGVEVVEAKAKHHRKHGRQPVHIF